VTSCATGETLFQLQIQFDRYASETAWALYNEITSTEIVSGSGYEDGQNSLALDHCVVESPGSTCFKFIISDSGDDGICCLFGDGSYSISLGEVPVQTPTTGAFASSDTTVWGPDCPTESPSSAPTGKPSSMPSKHPSAVPSSAPSQAPTFICTAPNKVFDLSIVFDNYPEETSWVLSNVLTGEDITYGSGYTSADVNIDESLCLDAIPGSICYSFTVFDTGSDGFCCFFGTGSYAISYGGESIPTPTTGSFAASDTTIWGPDCPTESPTSSPSGTPSSLPSMAPTAVPSSMPSQAPTLVCTEPDKIFHLSIAFDNYPSDTSWVLSNVFSNEEIAQGSGYLDGAVGVDDTYCLSAISGSICYSFTIYDLFGDGICCFFGTGSYSISYDGKYILSSGGAFAFSETTLFGADCPETTTQSPVHRPTAKPSRSPTKVPTKSPTAKPTRSPTKVPTKSPSAKPTKSPTAKPTLISTKVPTKSPIVKHSERPTNHPTSNRSLSPAKSLIETETPSSSPFVVPQPSSSKTTSSARRLQVRWFPPPGSFVFGALLFCLTAL